MKNTFGNTLTVTLFGESHGEMIGAVLDGLCPGLPIEEESINDWLRVRRPASAADTARREPDEYRIVSGVYRGKTTGTPLCILIPNKDAHGEGYEKQYGQARPSHADYTAYCKYHGFEDPRGGGHFSGRITAALTAAGALLAPSLKRLGITLGTHIKSCAGISDRSFSGTEQDLFPLCRTHFPVLNPESGAAMEQAILRAHQNGNSVGGVTETMITGTPAGVGEPWFDSVEGMLSHALFSIGGIKGVEFGDGFAFADSEAPACNDAFRMENGAVVTKTNHNGGINGGITNGMPILFRCAVKPTPSVALPQETVNFLKRENTGITVIGRHDPAIIRRICPVINSVTTLVLCDLLAGRYGTDLFLRRKEAL